MRHKRPHVTLFLARYWERYLLNRTVSLVKTCLSFCQEQNQSKLSESPLKCRKFGQFPQVDILLYVSSFSWAITPMTYSASFMFSTPSTAYLSVACLIMLTGMLTIMTTFILEFLGSGDEVCTGWFTCYQIRMLRL